MCSIAMPAELILHSPPVYSSLLYGPLVVTAPTITNRSVPPRIRPCLSTGSLPLDSLRNNDGKQKKRVVFADDRGRPLTQVFPRFSPSFHRDRIYGARSVFFYSTDKFYYSYITLVKWCLTSLASIKKEELVIDYLLCRKSKVIKFRPL